MAWNATTERMEVRQDIRTIYDLGKNPTEVKFYDDSGWAFTETRTYARGYQLTAFSTSEAGGVTVNTSGSYTYDTNNNLTGTKKLDATRGATQLVYRAQWTFTFDRRNRLKSHTNTNTGGVRGNIWYDGQGRVWQRWNDNSGTSEWDAALTRFVYDGSQLVQEHEFDAAEVEGEWEYTYSDLTRDYLRHAAGLRQRQRSGGSDTDYFVQLDRRALEYKAERDPVSASVTRDERSSSLDQISGGTFQNISNLATSGNYIERYGDPTTGFDALIQRGGRHYLAGLRTHVSRRGNCPFRLEPGDELTAKPGGKLSISTVTPSPGPGPEGTGPDGQPLLPEPADCCEWDACMWDKHGDGWFEFCCNMDCFDIEIDTLDLGEGCPPPCTACGGTVGSDCWWDHCRWSFGCGGYCGVNHINFRSCDPAQEALVKLWFRKVCHKLPNCACSTYDSDFAKAFLDSEAWTTHPDYGDFNKKPRLGTWQDVYGCLAELCRTGGFTVECVDCVVLNSNNPCCQEDLDYWAHTGRVPGFWGGYGDWMIFLCWDKLSSDAFPHIPSGNYHFGANTLLHEMAHLCGVGWGGDFEPVVAPGGVYSEGSGAAYLADKCINMITGEEGDWDSPIHEPGEYPGGNPPSWPW